MKLTQLAPRHFLNILSPNLITWVHHLNAEEANNIFPPKTIQSSSTWSVYFSFATLCKSGIDQESIELFILHLMFFKKFHILFYNSIFQRMLL